MPPRKNTDGKSVSTAKKTREKKVKEKPLKPKLKTPTVIKVKIPVAGSRSKANCDMSPKRTTKLTKKQQLANLHALTKIDLANEVAAAQLKKPTLSLAFNEVLAHPEEIKPKMKRQKQIYDECLTSSHESDDVFEPCSPVKKKVRREALKVAKKKSTVKKSPIKKSLKLKKKTDAISTKPTRRLATAKKKSNAKIGKNVDVTQTDDSHLPNDDDHLPSNDGRKSSEPSGVLHIPGTIDSRKTSLNSGLSWTKDISSSSTTTCLTVCSTDFVRYDKKMPLVKLENFEMQTRETENSLSSSSSDSFTTDNAPSPKRKRELTPGDDFRSLDLSTSSITSTKSTPSLRSRDNSFQKDVVNEVGQKKPSKALAMDKLTAKLKEFDLEIINWIGYDNEQVDVDMKILQSDIVQVLKEESQIITHCEHLKRVLSDNVPSEDVHDGNETDVHPINIVTDEINNEDFESRNGDENLNPSSPKKITSEENENRNYDDDDALSLFAESITGIDTSTTSVVDRVGKSTEIEEYVPRPVEIQKWAPTQKVTYQPTKIFTNEPQNLPNDLKTKIVCEKQNADSTSIKDTEQERFSSVHIDKPNQLPQVIRNPIPNFGNYEPQKIITRRPNLICFSYKQPPGTRSMILRGMCFFNLLGSCKSKNDNLECRYKHEVPTHIDITAKLVRLSEEMFIQEYMLFREWPILRRKYGMCFVVECIRRDLTRILVEMAIDFIVKAVESIWEDVKLKVEVIELVLLHLNSVDLETCEDLLAFTAYQVPLCDLLMQAIANTQNFSRFKPVFIKLTNFILQYRRNFSFDVATQILERLSILPCEQPLLEALLEIVKHTDRKILDNSMMARFEKQLSLNKELHDQLLELRKGFSVNRPVPGAESSLYQSSPKLNPEIEPLMSISLMAPEREKRYTSPDTTNLDNMNKTTDEPVSTPTTEFNRLHLFGNIQRTISNSNPKDSDEFRPKTVIKNTPNYHNWKNKSIFNSIQTMSPVLRHQSPRPGRYVHQMRNFVRGPSPSKFMWRPGPDNY